MQFILPVGAHDSPVHAVNSCRLPSCRLVLQITNTLFYWVLVI
jgi:hypothetical protein